MSKLLLFKDKDNKRYEKITAKSDIVEIKELIEFYINKYGWKLHAILFDYNPQYYTHDNERFR